MERLEKTKKEIAETNKKFMARTGPGSKTAMTVALNRLEESMRPEGERICYDPYAIHFVNPAILEWAIRNPDEAKATREQYERFLPGLFNSIVARVRYFDDFIKKSIKEGLEQLVILGAGYDSRAYRMDGLKNIRVFEVDHPDTQTLKIGKIKKILGSLPDNVVYVPADLGTEAFGQRLLEMGYDRSRKTLFLLEGLLYYLQPVAVDKILSFIVKNSDKGCEILFDYFPQYVVDGSSTLEVGRNIHDHLAQIGEPLQFGVNEGMVETFLSERGFSRIRNVTSDDYKKAYFHGVNEGRAVCSLLYFAHAVIE